MTDSCVRALLFQSPHLMLRVSEFVGHDNHHCQFCVAALRCTTRLDYAVVSVLRHRTWPFCCVVGRRPSYLVGVAEGTLALDVVWQTNSSVVSTAYISWRELHEASNSEAYGVECIVRPFREWLQLPSHFPSIIEPFIYPSMMDEYLQGSKGRIHLSIRSRNCRPSALLQTIPPRADIFRMLHKEIDEGRLGQFKVLCTGCFCMIGRHHAIECSACGATPLCPSCLPAHRKPTFCIFCVQWLDGDELSNMLCVRRYWYEAGGAPSRHECSARGAAAISRIPHII